MRKATYITASAALIALIALLALPGCSGSGTKDSTIGRQAMNVARESRQESGTAYTIGPQFENHLEAMIQKEVAALGVEEGKEGVPMELNREVLLNINYFLNRGRGFMTRGLSLGSKYIPMMKAIFRQKGLPEDLVYLALIESGFKTSAVSPASAVGPWQFIASTGRRYGLTINEYVDERMDPVKSTYAAADYLTTLHDMFNSWPLAIAAYNSGEGKILKGMKNYGVSNFWDMSEVGGHLAGETRLYVPSFLAATFIAKDPEAYGFKIETQPPDQWDEVVAPEPLTFSQAAKLAGTTTERLKELNPHLKKMTTPPDETDFVLRIPAGSLDKFAKAYQGGRGTKTAAARLHVVKKGETLETVAAQYGLSADLLKDYNNLRSTTLRAGAKLNLPPQSLAAAGAEIVEYTIRPGDTKTGLSSMFGQSWGDIAALNRLDKNYRLMAGKTIKVVKTPAKKTAAVAPPPARPGALGGASASSTRLSTITHKVQAGDTLAAISRLYGLPMESIKSANGMKSNTVYRGQILRIKSDLPIAVPAPKTGRGPVMVVETTPPPADAVHTVTKGDTLMGVARKYGMSAKELADLNNIEGVTIKVGQKLKVRGQAPAAAAARPGVGAHTVKAGESLSVIAEKYGMSTRQLADLNGLKGTTIRVGQTLKLAAPPKSAPAAPAPKPKSANPALHIVKAGESLSVIAEKYGMSTRQLADLNGLKGTAIRAGQKLKVGGRSAAAAPPAPKADQKPAAAAPGQGVKGGTHTVAAGETLYSIAKKYGLTVEELQKLNPGLSGVSIKSGQKLALSAPAKPAAPSTHQVAAGDTLYSIALKYGTTVDALKKINNLKGDNVRLGQKLKVK